MSETSTNLTSPFLNRERKSVVLGEKIALSHNSFLFRFNLPNKDQVLGLPVGNHFKVFSKNFEGVEKGKWNGRPDSESEKQQIERNYTPISSADEKGHFDLVIKVYGRGSDLFPDGGKVSQYLDSLSIGDSIDIAGPYGLIEYKAPGLFLALRKEKRAKTVGMIAGGTGITPILAVLNAALNNDDDKTKFSLLYSNQHEEDILLRDRLEDYAARFPDRFSLWFTISRASGFDGNWNYAVGRITKEMITNHLPAPSEDCLILLCGPPAMVEASKANLNDLGFSKPNILTF